MGENKKQFLLFITVLLSRIPFLFDGYGVEEDSWGHVLNAALMNETGMYEISRLPGHPLFEALLLIFWHVQTPLVYNVFAALTMAGSAVVYYQILRFYNVNYTLGWAFAFSFIPIIFISSTYTIDYIPALFFVLLSIHAVLFKNEERAGIWLAVAAAIRLTSLGMILPLTYIILQDKSKEKSVALRMRRVVKMTVLSLITSFIFYLPPFKKYGLDFFDFHKPPYPNLLEAFYKMTFGVWGVVGGVACAICIIYLARKKEFTFKSKYFFMLFITTIVYAIAYFRMPEKAAFWIPVLPFVILIFAAKLSKPLARFTIIMLVISPFLLGINKTDPYTGAHYSSLAITFGSNNGQLFLDPINGPLLNDFTKRKNKLAACEKIEHNMMLQRQPTLIIAGWWYAMIEVDRRAGKWSNANIKTVYYASPEELETWQNKGYQLRYLPEQERVNDKKYSTTFTVDNATLFPID